MPDRYRNLNLRLPLHDPNRFGQRHDEMWCLGREDLFTALLLEVGTPVNHEPSSLPHHWYNRLLVALNKYYLHSCTVPFHLAASSMADQFLDWLDERREGQ